MAHTPNHRNPWAAPLAAALLMAPCAARADADAGPFAEGSIRLALMAGASTTVDGKGETHTAIIAGLGGGYYLVDGLELGLEGEHWFGADPSVSKVSPGVRYVLWFVPVLKPYAGMFYRHVFLGAPFDDFDSLGTRAGAFWVSGGGSYFGGGVVYEQIVKGCPDGWDCSSWYPELALSISL